MYMKGLSDAQNPGAIPLDVFMSVSPTGVWSQVVDSNSASFEANYPMDVTKPGSSVPALGNAPSTILGVPTRNVVIGALIAAVLLYIVYHKKD